MTGTDNGIVCSGQIKFSSCSDMGRLKQKGKAGAAKAYITRSAAIKKLQCTLADFRRLCILKGQVACRHLFDINHWKKQTKQAYSLVNQGTERKLTKDLPHRLLSTMLKTSPTLHTNRCCKSFVNIKRLLRNCLERWVEVNGVMQRF